MPSLCPPNGVPEAELQTNPELTGCENAKRPRGNQEGDESVKCVGDS